MDIHDGGSFCVWEASMNTNTTMKPAGRLPDLMPIRELAERSGLGRSRAYELLRDGLLPLRRIKVAGRVYVSRRQYEAWIGADEPADAGEAGD